MARDDRAIRRRRPVAWFAKIDDEVVGPLSDRDVHRLVREGKILRRTRIRRDDGPWSAAENFKSSVPDPDDWREHLGTRPYIAWGIAAAVAAVAIILLFVGAFLPDLHSYYRQRCFIFGGGAAAISTVVFIAGLFAKS
jgi:hypothetical protein